MGGSSKASGLEVASQVIGVQLQGGRDLGVVHQYGQGWRRWHSKWLSLFLHLLKLKLLLSMCKNTLFDQAQWLLICTTIQRSPSRLHGECHLKTGQGKVVLYAYNREGEQTAAHYRFSRYKIVQSRSKQRSTSTHSMIHPKHSQDQTRCTNSSSSRTHVPQATASLLKLSLQYREQYTGQS